MPQDLVNKSRVRAWCLVYSAIHVAVFGFIFLSGIQFGPSTELVLYLLFTLGPTIYFVEIYARFFYRPYHRYERRLGITVSDVDRPHPFHTGKFFGFVLFFGGALALVGYWGTFDMQTCTGRCEVGKYFSLVSTPALLLSVIAGGYMSWRPENG